MTRTSSSSGNCKLPTCASAQAQDTELKTITGVPVLVLFLALQRYYSGLSLQGRCEAPLLLRGLDRGIKATIDAKSL
jgi:hypothetical protein